MLQAELSTFFQRWHALEKSRGSAGGLVVDFDMAPRALHGQPRPYPDRWAALQDLMVLRERVADEQGLWNPVFLAAKLEGAEAYLRALLGERADAGAYLGATMGMFPIRPDPDAMEAEARSLAAAFEERGVPWAQEGRAAWRAEFGRPDLGGFEADLRQAASHLVARLRGRLPGLAMPVFAVKVVETDAYWSNWIDGSVESGVTLQVNTHPRIEYQRTAHLALAAHEIAGHACHVAGLRGAAEAGRLDPAALNLAVHSCEAFQMEGLAQTMLHLLLEDHEIPGDLRLLERYRAYRGARINDAWMDLEAGAPIDVVCRALERDLPLAGPLGLRSGLRDRARNPLYRSYISVYAPSRSLFMQALDLSGPARQRFLAATVMGLWTPGQLAALVRGADPEEVRRGPSPGVIDGPVGLGR
ncbi:MAG: hypothetical protein VX000_04675 [Myxococcota bacterium]|nr:hypothetical protein [Myxococcota bacterium]